MSDAGKDVVISYGVDPGNSEAVIKAVEAASNKMVASVAKAATVTSAQTSAAVQKALDSITTAEREMANQVKASDAILRAKAQALGLTVAQTRKLELQNGLLAQAEAKAAAAVQAMRAAQEQAASAAAQAATAERVMSAAVTAANGAVEQHSASLTSMRRALVDAARREMDLEHAAKGAAQGLKQAGPAAKAAASGMGAGAAAASNLRSQLFDIGQQLSAGTNPLIILSQQGPQIAEAMMSAAGGMKALEAALASTAAIVAPIAVSLGALYVGWRIYSEDTTRAQQVTEAQMKALDAIRPSLDAVRDATIRLAMATGELTEEQGKQAQASWAALRAFQAASAETTDRLAELNKEQNSVKTQIVDMVGGFLDVVDVAGINTAAFDALTTSSDELGQEVDALRGVQDQHINAMGRQVDLTHEAITAETANASAIKGTAAAIREARKEHEAWIKATMEQVDRLGELLGIVVEADRNLAYFTDAAELAANALPPSTVTRWAELGAAVDEAVPAKALSRFDQLQLLLLDLELEASKSAEAALALAGNIEAVQRAIAADDMARQMKLLDQATKDAAATADQLRLAFDRVGEAISRAAGMVGGLFSALTGGSLDSLLTPSGAVSVAGESGEDGSGAAVRAMMDAAVAFVQTVIAELPALLDALAGGIPHVLQAVIKGIPDIVQALVDAIPDLFAALAEKLPKLLIVLAEQIPVLLTAVVKQLPTLVLAIVDAIPEIIQALVKGLPALFDAIFAAIPEIIIGVIDAIPDIIAAVLEALPTIVFGLIDAIFTELIPRLPEIAIAMAAALIEIVGVIAKDFVDKLKALILDIIPAIARDFMQAIKDLVTPGGKDKDSDGKTGVNEFFDSIGDLFGDTPGPIKAPMDGLRARFAPGDYVVAARSMEGLRAQVGPGAGAAPSASSGPSSVRLDLSDGHIAFDRLFRQNIAAGGTLATLRTGTTGQTRIY